MLGARVFWTRTLWRDTDAMRDFMRTQRRASHGDAKAARLVRRGFARRLGAGLAAGVDRGRSADRRSGRTSRVRHPSPAQARGERCPPDRPQAVTSRRKTACRLRPGDRGSFSPLGIRSLCPARPAEPPGLVLLADIKLDTDLLEHEFYGLHRVVAEGLALERLVRPFDFVAATPAAVVRLGRENADRHVSVAALAAKRQHARCDHHRAPPGDRSNRHAIPAANSSPRGKSCWLARLRLILALGLNTLCTLIRRRIFGIRGHQIDGQILLPNRSAEKPSACSQQGANSTDNFFSSCLSFATRIGRLKPPRIPSCNADNACETRRNASDRIGLLIGQYTASVSRRRPPLQCQALLHRS